jgi:uncharacterized damage-inducible protein DinB
MSDPFIDVTLQQWAMHRDRTLATLDAIAALPDPAACLGWRPGSGRAHIAWQLVHVAVTEELFATDRLRGTPPSFADLVPRFRGGSTPDDDIPSLDAIRACLSATREHLLATAATVTTAELETVPPALAARNITVRQAFRILAWHEAHHQGQAHITLNLFKARG